MSFALNYYDVQASYQACYSYVKSTELDYSSKRNTAFLLYNQLTNDGALKCLCHTINSWYKFL